MRLHMNHIDQPWWLTASGKIIGFDEGDGDGGAGDGGDGNEGDGDGGAGEGDGDGDGSGDGNQQPDDLAGLKAALAAERKEKKALAKANAALTKTQQAAADAEKTEIQRLTDAQTATVAKTEKLAAGYKAKALETAVLAAAALAKFKDPTDALRSEVLAAIGVEQDEDDPTQVEVDPATVTAAIKALVKSKPHYLAAPIKPGGGAPSGSRFGGANGGGQSDPKVEELKTRYPALRNRV